MVRYVKSDEADWPKPCPGGCGRTMRAPHQRAAHFPGRQTFAAVNNAGWCHNCSGRKRERVEKPAESEEKRLARMRADLDAMIASRRRRGVPPEGIAMPGEKLDDPGRSRDLPTRAVPLEKATITDEAPLGYCAVGHPYTKFDRKGHRFCQKCYDNRQALAVAKRREALRAPNVDRKPSPEAPLGRCLMGHPYTAQHGTGKNGQRRMYCGTCKKARNLRRLAGKRMEDGRREAA